MVPSRSLVSSRAFTLPELLVTFVVIALVASIIYPTFTAALDRGAEQYAQGSVAQVRAGELAWAAANGAYTNTPANLRLPPTLRATTLASPGPDDVSIAVGDDGSVGIAARAETGRCAAAWLSAPDPTTSQPLQVWESPGHFLEPADCSGAGAIDQASAVLVADGVRTDPIGVLPAASQ